MSLKIDRVQLQFEIQPDYDQQQLQKLEDDLKKANEFMESAGNAADSMKEGFYAKDRKDENTK